MPFRYMSPKRPYNRAHVGCHDSDATPDPTTPNPAAAKRAHQAPPFVPVYDFSAGPDEVDLLATCSGSDQGSDEQPLSKARTKGVGVGTKRPSRSKAMENQAVVKKSRKKK